MINIIKKIILFCLYCLVSHVCFAQEGHSQISRELKSLLENKEYQTAWILAQNNENDYLGEPEFDYFYGLAALEAKAVQRAVFAFERVIVNVPHWHEARFLLAKSYFLANNFQAAKQETEFLLEKKLTDENLKRASDNLNIMAIAKLNKQTLFIQQLVSVAMGRDTNANAGTAEDSIFIPSVGDVLLSDASKASDDNFATVNYLVNINKPIDQKSKVNVLFRGLVTQFQSLSQYDRALGHLKGEYHYDFDTVRVYTGLQLMPLWLDKSLYRQDTAFLTGLGFDYSDWQLSTNMQLGKVDNKADNDLDTQYQSVSFSGGYQQQQIRHNLFYSFKSEQSDLNQAGHNNKKVHSSHYQALFLINEKWLTSGSVGFQSSDYKVPHSTFLIVRKDEMYTFNASIQYIASPKISYRLNLSHQNKDSNLDIFSYKRNEINFTASYSF